MTQLCFDPTRFFFFGSFPVFFHLFIYFVASPTGSKGIAVLMRWTVSSSNGVAGVVVDGPMRRA